MTTQNYINHIVLVADASASMSRIAEQVIKVADDQTAYLAQRSKELDQETRVTVYTFGARGTEACLFYDKDVLRLPSLRGNYVANSPHTALIDATIKALDDLAKTPELYGDHAFLVYVLTDGQDNDSFHRSTDLAERMARLPNNWTVACLVPNANGVYEAKKDGFSADNISIWDATSSRGMEEAGRTIRAATESFMVARSQGIRSSRGLFTLTDPAAVQTGIITGKLHALHPGQYRLLAVDRDEVIAPFVENQLRVPYRLGMAYYQLTKSETVQASKDIAIRDKKTYQLYVGLDARQLLGLPPYEIRVSPTFNPQYDIYVQSTSVNRKLIAGTTLLVLS